MIQREIDHHKWFGDVLRTKKRGFAVKQNVVEKYSLALHDHEGKVIDLSVLEADVNEPLDAKVAFREASLLENTVIVDLASIIDPVKGISEFFLPDEVINNAAIYLGELAISGRNSGKIFILNEFYVYIEPSLWGERATGPVPLAEIRQSLRDSSPFENELLANYEYDVADISYAAARTVRYWNEMPPKVAFFTTRLFPFTNLWITGCHLFLFELIQEHYRKNYFPYSAGGISIDDRNKFQIYHAAWSDRFQLFTRDIRMLKVSINAESSAAVLPGAYRYYGI